eukprot:477605-Prymnesium_polylepis.2
MFTSALRSGLSARGLTTQALVGQHCAGEGVAQNNDAHCGVSDRRCVRRAERALWSRAGITRATIGSHEPRVCVQSTPATRSAYSCMPRGRMPTIGSVLSSESSAPNPPARSELAPTNQAHAARRAESKAAASCPASLRLPKQSSAPGWRSNAACVAPRVCAHACPRSSQSRWPLTPPVADAPQPWLWH